jgi:hypothetical protein
MYNSTIRKSVDPNLVHMRKSIAKDHILDMRNPLSDETFRQNYMKLKEEY